MTVHIFENSISVCVGVVWGGVGEGGGGEVDWREYSG